MSIGAISLELSNLETQIKENEKDKLNKLKDNLLANNNLNSSNDEKQQSAKVAIDFEAMLIKQMLTSMTKSLDGEGFFGTGAGSSIYQDMFINEISQNMAKNQSFGLAEQILQQVDPKAIENLPKLRNQTDKRTTRQDRTIAIASVINSNKENNNRISNTYTDNPHLNSPQPHSEREEKDSMNTVYNGKSALPPTKKVAEVISQPKTLLTRLQNYDHIIQKASDVYGIDKSIIKAIIAQESYGNKNAVSPVGAKGLMQLMDGTAKELGVKDSFDPEENIMAGTNYLRKMLNNFGDIKLALAAYNAGPGNVKKYNGIPPFKETQNYVKKVLKFVEQL